MKQFSKSQVLLLALVIVQSLFKDSEANHTHRRRHHHRHSHRHHVTGFEEDLLRQQSLEETEEPTFVAAYRNISREEDEDDNSMPNSVESVGSSASFSLERYGTYLCLEDEDDVERGIRHLGVKCVCPKTEAPVCGSDGVTYFNRCFLVCRARHARLTYHRYRITLRKFGAC